MRNLLPALIVLIGAVPSFAALSVVQDTAFQSTSASGTISVTLSSAPTNGNILIAAIGYKGGNTVTAPDGTWTKIDSGGTAPDGLDTWWHPVLSSAPSTYTFTVNGAQDFVSIVMFEITGASTSSAVNQHTMLGVASATSAFTTTSAIPSVVGTLALSFATTDAGSTSAPDHSSGWTNDAGTPSGTWHSLFSGHQTTLTTDTSTAVSDTFTFIGQGVGAVSLVIVSPTTGSASVKARMILQ